MPKKLKNHFLKLKTFFMRIRDSIHSYLLLTFILLLLSKIISDLLFFTKKKNFKYYVFVAFILIFLFKNVFNWILAVSIALYGIYVMLYLDMDAPMPTNFNLTWHLTYFFSEPSSVTIFVFKRSPFLIYILVLLLFFYKKTRIVYRISTVDSMA